MATQNLAALEAFITDLVEETMLPAGLADVSPEDRLHLDRYARRLHVTPAAALSIAREATRAEVAHSRHMAAVVTAAQAQR